MTMDSFHKKSKSKTKIPKVLEPDNTRRKRTLPECMRVTMWTPGKSANPNGRPKGSRNKLSERFVRALLEDFDQYGDIAIADCRAEDPARYCAIIASIIPKDFEEDDKESTIEKLLERFTTVEELQQFIAGIGAIGAKIDSAEKVITSATRGQSNGVH